MPKIKPPPRGMWFEHRAGRDLPFVARWRLSGGKKESQAFATERDRAEFADAWATRRKNFGQAAAKISPRVAEVLAEFAKITGGADPLAVAREWVHLKKIKVVGLSLSTAWARFNEDQERRAVAADSHSHRRLHGKRIVEHFGGDVEVSAITSDQIDAWIFGLVDPKSGEPMGSKTRDSHLKTMRQFFNWLWLRREIEHNAALAVTPPERSIIDEETGEVQHRDINIFTVDEARHFFAVNCDALCVGRLALEAFGGLRYTSAARLRRHHIDWDSQGIEMPGHLHKSGARKFVQGWPENLWQWMRHTPDACWDLSQRIYADQKRAAFERAGMKPPEPDDDRQWTAEEQAAFEAMRNVMRHSFATYHLAAFRRPPDTLELMTKTSISSLNRDYRGRATQVDGVAYFGITP